MSAIVFELKEEHVKLLKHLRWSVDDNKVIVNKANEGDEIAPPFGFDTIYEAIDLILNGKSPDIDPFTHEDLIEYSEEQKAAWDKLYSELPMALDLILHNGHFELGKYKTRYYVRDWKKVK